MDDLDNVRSYLGRPHALVHAVRQTQLPRMNALVAGAGAVLGTAVRDRDLLLGWLGSDATASPGDRDAVIVALGLLGDVPHLDRIWEEPADTKQTAIVIAAIVLGVDSREERLRLLEAVERGARGPAIGAAEQALFREQTGNRLAVLD